MKKMPASLLLRSGLVLLLLLVAGACRDVQEGEEPTSYSFILDTPPDGATEVDRRVLLHWSIWTNFELVDSARLCFGTSNPPPFLRWTSRQDSGYFRPGPLEPGTTYYWQLDIPSPAGTSPVRSFTVGSDRTLWTYMLPPGQSVYDVNGTPEVLGNRVFQRSEKGLLHCLDAVSGALLWIFDSTQTGSIARSRMAAVERIYYNNGIINCLNAATGALLWRAAPPSNSGYRPPLALGDRVFAHSNERISCLDAATGHELWGVDRVLCTTMAAAGGRVFVTTNSSVYYDGTNLLECLDAETGLLLWSRDFGKEFPEPREPAATDSSVYIGCGSRLYCLDAGSGTTRWEYAALERAANPFVLGEQLLLSEGQDRYALLDAASGARLWQAELLDTPERDHYTSINGDPVLLGGNIILADTSGYVYCLDAASGAMRWHYFVSTDLMGIAKWGNRVYVTGDDEYLFCIRTD